MKVRAVALACAILALGAAHAGPQVFQRSGAGTAAAWGTLGLSALSDGPGGLGGAGYVLCMNPGGTAWTWCPASAGGAESDPVFIAAPAAGITAQQVTEWGTAYGWGNHAAAGYLTSAPAESDPIFGASPAAGIAAQDLADFAAAYGWGNHAAAGYRLGSVAIPWGDITGTPTTCAGYGITDCGTGTGGPESDPIFGASPAAGITAQDLADYATAHAWGNHAAAGYLADTDPRLSDARTPTAHASTHATGGSDPITPAAIGAEPAGVAAADITDSTAIGQSLVTASSMPAARQAIAAAPACTCSLSGLELEYVDGDTVRVATGWARSEDGSTYVVTSAQEVTIAPIAAATWYHLYITGDNTIEVSTTAPTAPYAGTARGLPGDTSARWIGSRRTLAASAALVQFYPLGGADRAVRWAYAANPTVSPYRFVALGAQTGSFAYIDLSATGTASLLSPGAVAVIVNAWNSSSTGGNTLQLTFGPYTGAVQILQPGAAFQVSIPTPEQTVGYRMASAAGAYLDFVGQEELR